MKFKYIVIPAALLLAGAGCVDAQPVAVNQQPASQQQPQKPEASQSPWKLAFNLPSGWRYAGDADWQSPMEKPINKASDDVFLVNVDSSRKFYASAGAAPDWATETNSANHTNAIGIQVVFMGNDYKQFGGDERLSKKNAEQKSDMLFLDKFPCEVAPEECQLPGTNGVTYLLKMPSGALYTAHLHTNKKDVATLKMIEDILKTSKENK